MSSVVVTSNLYLLNKTSKESMVNAAISVGMLVTGYAKDLCPVSPGGGTLRNSITYGYSENVTESSVVLEVGTNVEYGPYVELGHRQQPGRYVPAIGKRLVRSWVPGKPFLRPAFENHVDEIEKTLLDTMK